MVYVNDNEDRISIKVVDWDGVKKQKQIYDVNSDDNSDNIDEEGEEFYKKKEFLNSKEARMVRILSEFVGVENALKNKELFFTISIFGSARSLSADQYEKKKIYLEKCLEKYAEKIRNGVELNSEEIKERDSIAEDLRILKKLSWTTEYYEKVRELSKKLTCYFETEEGQETLQKLSLEIPNDLCFYMNGKEEKDEEHKKKRKRTNMNKDKKINKNINGNMNGNVNGNVNGVTDTYNDKDKDNDNNDKYDKNKDKENNLVNENRKHTWNVSICTGGGPGFMEAANKGCREAGGKSMGLSIALPYEEKANPYVDNELSFKFHYFFTRKFWLVYLSIAFIIFPGGFGTLDEFFELMNLKECKKIKRDIPIILFGKDFWEQICNFQKLADYGLISESALTGFYIADSVDSAFEYITTRWKNKPFIGSE